MWSRNFQLIVSVLCLHCLQIALMCHCHCKKQGQIMLFNPNSSLRAITPLHEKLSARRQYAQDVKGYIVLNPRNVIYEFFNFDFVSVGDQNIVSIQTAVADVVLMCK